MAAFPEQFLPANMDRPLIPVLHGPHDFARWDTALTLCFRFLSLLPAITQDAYVENPRIYVWEAGQGDAVAMMIMLTCTSEDVKDWLVESGYDQTSRDPKVLYDHIRSHFQDPSNRLRRRFLYARLRPTLDRLRPVFRVLEFALLLFPRVMAWFPMTLVNSAFWLARRTPWYWRGIRYLGSPAAVRHVGIVLSVSVLAMMVHDRWGLRGGLQ